MSTILCTFGIHKYDEWKTIFDDDGNPIVIKLCDLASQLSVGQVIVQLRKCDCCGKVQSKRIEL